MAHLITSECYFPFPTLRDQAIGAGTAYPIPDQAFGDVIDADTSLQVAIGWFWRVKRWRMNINNLQNEFAGYADHSFEFLNHFKGVGLDDPEAVYPESEKDLLTKYGLNLEYVYTTTDGAGDPWDFRVRIVAFHEVAKDETGWWALHFQLDLDLLLPGNLPPQEIALRTVEGSNPRGYNLTIPTPPPYRGGYLIDGQLVGGASTQLYSGFPGQLATDWFAEITMEPIEYWEYAPGTWDTSSGELLLPDNCKYRTWITRGG